LTPPLACGYGARLPGPAGTGNRIFEEVVMAEQKLRGAELVIKALVDQGVDVIFGYPGGAVLPIYDALFKQNAIRHVLVRHEQGAVHAAEGYARSTGKPGVVLVTSGPGATNAVTGLADAMMDSIPVVCITGQVATHLIGNDAFQEADTVGITRPVTKHNWLVKSADDVARVMHEAFFVATNGRPGPVVVDLPKDIQIAAANYVGPANVRHKTYRPATKGDRAKIEEALEAMAHAKRPLFYTGGGVVNAGPAASLLLREFVQATGYPITNTLMGLGTYPASDKQFLGLVGMHGTYESNMAMYECDVMIAIGSRFDDRVTGKVDEFSPNSIKIHVDIDRSSINKNIAVDIPIVGDAGLVLEDMIKIWKSKGYQPDKKALKAWWETIAKWRTKESLKYKKRTDEIMPQHAIQRLFELTRDMDPIITTEVGQHQMWAAQFFGFEKPNRWLTSGGLGTMGYGLPAAIGAQVGNPGKLVVDVAGEASILMNIQELSTAVQHELPVKVFIVNNQYMGMVRQWQELSYDGRYSHSYTDSLPDFVKLAEAFGATGLRITDPKDLDKGIKTMIETKGPVIVDCQVVQTENCYPMVPAGAAHYQMIFGPEEEREPVSDEDLAVV
jgi:acetolactate synthase I/II/III large subunit